jgi:hypothetical protein
MQVGETHHEGRNPGHSLVTRIEGKPSRVKATGLCLGSARKLSLWSERLGKVGVPSKHQQDIETVGLPAFTRSTRCRSFSPDMIIGASAQVRMPDHG